MTDSTGPGLSDTWDSGSLRKAERAVKSIAFYNFLRRGEVGAPELHCGPWSDNREHHRNTTEIPRANRAY